MTPQSVTKFANNVKEKYSFYDGDFSYADKSSDKVFAGEQNRVGWAHRAVSMMANKTHFDRFENDSLGFNELFIKYRGKQAFEKVKSDPLIAGVAFLAFTGKRIMPFTALEATGRFDWNEQNLNYGVAIFRENSKQTQQGDEPSAYMVFTPEYTQTIDYDDNINSIALNTTGRPLITLLTHRSSARRPFGHSVITCVVRDAVIGASRTTKQSEIASHHYNTKMRALLGVDIETGVQKLESKTGDILMVGSNENGQVPSLGEFAQHQLTPFKSQIEIFAQNFCSETNLTMSDLGVATSAPQNPESLKIAKDDFIDEIHEWQSEMGEQLKYFMTTVYMYENNLTELDENLIKKIDEISVAWMPIYRDDMSKFGDGLQKSAAVAPAITKARSIYLNAGFTSREIDEIVESAEQTISNGLTI